MAIESPISSSSATCATRSPPRPPTASSTGGATGASASCGFPAARPIPGLPDMDLAAARAAGAKTLVVGAVNAGGVLPEHWIATIVEAIEAGMDVASGLHDRLSAPFPAIRAAAEKHGAQLHDVRHADRAFADRQGHAPAGQAAPDGRHRLLGRQEIRGAGAGEGDDARAATTPSSARPGRRAC